MWTKELLLGTIGKMRMIPVVTTGQKKLRVDAYTRWI